VDADAADDRASCARQEVAEHSDHVAASGVAVLPRDVWDDEEVSRQHLAAAEVGAALQLAAAVQSLFLVAHGQAFVAVDHPQAARLQGEHLEHRLGIGKPERAPPVAVRLLHRRDADRAVAMGKITGRLVAGITIHAVGLARIGKSDAGGGGKTARRQDG